MSVHPDPSNDRTVNDNSLDVGAVLHMNTKRALPDEVSDFLPTGASEKSISGDIHVKPVENPTRIALPPISGQINGMADSLQAGLHNISGAVNSAGQKAASTLHNAEQQILTQASSTFNTAGKHVSDAFNGSMVQQYISGAGAGAGTGTGTAGANSQAQENWETVHEAIYDGELFSTKQRSFPEKFLPSLMHAVRSGDWNLTKLLLDKVHEQTTDVFLGDLIVADELTMLEFCGETGNTGLYDSLVEGRYAPTDPERRKNAHQKLIQAATVSHEDKKDASSLQLLMLIYIVQVHKDKHAMTARYYSTRHMYIFFLPATILSAIAGLLSFLSTSSISAGFGGTMSIIVGVMASVSALNQTISDQLGYSSIAAQHASAAHEMEGILEMLNFNYVDSLAGARLPITDNDLQTIKKQVSSIELTAKSPVPQFLDTFYDSLLNELQTYRWQARGGGLDDEVMIDLQSEAIQDAGLLTDRIVNSPLWPWTFSTQGVRNDVLNTLRNRMRAIAGADKAETFFEALSAFEKKRKPMHSEKV